MQHQHGRPVVADGAMTKSAHTTPDPPSVPSPLQVHRPSPLSSSARPSLSPSEDERDRSTPHSANSPFGILQQQQHLHLLHSTSPLSASTTASDQASRQRSHHAVPKRYRGPLPMLGDAEDIAPLPLLVPSAGSDLFNVLNHPLNRNSWRYTGAGPASQMLPQTVYRTLEMEPYGVHWSWSDRSAFTLLSADAAIVSASNGFRSARANVPVREGSWYVEIHILEPSGPPSNAKGGNNVRLGWARREAGLNAPVGSSGYSYGIRDATGEKVFLSRTYPYAQTFKPGDVVGMWINLPPTRAANPEDPLDPARIERKRLPIRYKGRLYFEQLEYATTKEMDHLMDRSRKGEKLITSRGPPAHDAVVNPALGLLASKETGASVNGMNGKKKKAGPPPPPGSGPSNASANNFRSLPTLGSESLIGFFINGVPQGIAFQNLLDFRPLRKHRLDRLNSRTKSASSDLAQQQQSGMQEDEKADIITRSSTAATIMKSRENHFDDGALGYFPFVSLYGNARARIVSRGDDFKYPPPANVLQALNEADRARGRPEASVGGDVSGGDDESREHSLVPCRALEQRYSEFLEEMWKYDALDEEKARLLAAKRADDSSSDEENGDTTVGRSSKKPPKKKHMSNLNASRLSSSTPAQNSPRSSNSPHPIGEKEREATADEEDSKATINLESANGSLDTNAGSRVGDPAQAVFQTDTPLSLKVESPLEAVRDDRMSLDE